MIDYLIFAATFVIGLVFAVIYLYPGSKKLTTVPGPEPVDPLEGNFPDITASGSLYEFLDKIHEIYGDVASFWAGPQLCISVASPTYFEQLTGYFDRPENLFQAPQLLWGDSAGFLMNGSAGRKQHDQLTKRYSAAFFEKNLKFAQNLMKEHIKAYAKWPKDQFVPLYESTSLVALEYLVTCLVPKGGKMEEEKEGVERDGRGDEEEEGVASGVVKEDLMGLKNNLDHAWAEVDHCIVDAQDIDGKREERLQKYRTAIESFIKKRLSKAGASGKDDVSEGVEQLLPIICDAYFKLSSLLTWFGYFIAMGTDVQTRLRKEMRKLDLQNVKVEDFNNMSFLQACMKETLRLGNIVPYTARVQNFETVFGEHKIPAGTPIFQALAVLSHREDIFEDAGSFNPDRFLSDTKPTPFACHPFGFAGRRKCPGAHLSTSFVALFYAHLLNSFEMELASNESVGAHYGFYVKPKEEVWLTLKKLPD